MIVGLNLTWKRKPLRQGLVLRRNDARLPTPRNIKQDTQFEVVPMRVDSVDQRTISSMIHRQVAANYAAPSGC